MTDDTSGIVKDVYDLVQTGVSEMTLNVTATDGVHSSFFNRL